MRATIAAIAVAIAFSTRADPVSAAIRLATRSRASHCAVVLDDPLLGKLVLEAWFPLVRTTAWERWRQEHDVVALVSLDVAPERLAAGLAELRCDLGEPYDVGGLLGFLPVLLWRWLGRKLRNPLESPHSLFCSELCATFLQRCGYPGADALDPSATSPEDLRRFLVASQEHAA